MKRKHFTQTLHQWCSQSHRTEVNTEPSAFRGTLRAHAALSAPRGAFHCRRGGRLFNATTILQLSSPGNGLDLFLEITGSKYFKTHRQSSTSFLPFKYNLVIYTDVKDWQTLREHLRVQVIFMLLWRCYWVWTTDHGKDWLYRRKYWMQELERGIPQWLSSRQPLSHALLLWNCPGITRASCICERRCPSLVARTLNGLCPASSLVRSLWRWFEPS